MDQESMRRLRLDRRLARRRGWITREERDRLLAELPDSSSKIAPPESDAPVEASGTSVPEADPERAPESGEG